jgi:hypothetical protein
VLYLIRHVREKEHKMKPKLDYRSIFVGLALGLVMAAALGAGVRYEQQSGRYQITTNEGHAFVLDTVTGEVWEKFEGSSSGDNTPGFSDTKLDLRKDAQGK